MRFGSVCSGIEAASVAWGPLGWTAAWFSEIEPFPCAVLKHHYPDVPNLGDMTKLPAMIRSGQVEVPDLLCGGTPCQAFSVAGLRQSLNDERGNLSLTFCEIADAIDEQRKSIIFWENVPGVLSTKDNAFGCFLGALAGEDDALVAPGGRWANAGFVDGPKRAVAWRVLDAQYFGVAQRRRRVFVVASARADFDPAAVLFEFEGVRRDSAPSREKGKISAAHTGFSVTGSVTGGYGPKLGTDESCQGSVIPQAIAWDEEMNASIEQAGTLLRGGAGGRHDGVMQPIPLNSMNALRDADADPSTGCGIGEAGEAMFTITKGHSHAVAQPIALQDITPREKAQNGRGWNDDGTAYTVDAAATQGVAQPIAFDGYNQTLSHTSQTIRSDKTDGDHIGMVMQSVAVADVGPTRGSSGPPYSRTGNERVETEALAIHAMQVRRLTPVECERLQGFPDNYTNIKDKCPDGPRYKALGNSWAVPVVRWIGERIGRALD